MKMTLKQARKNCVSFVIDTDILLETVQPMLKFGTDPILDLLLREHSPENDLIPLITGVLTTEILIKHFGKIVVPGGKVKEDE